MNGVDRIILEPLDVTPPWQDVDPDRRAGREAHERICALSATPREIAEITELATTGEDMT